MKKLILLSLIVLGLVASFASVEDSHFETGKNQLESMGYSNIKDTGFSSFCCSDQDEYSTGFEATDKNGDTIKGCFCSSASDTVSVNFK